MVVSKALSKQKLVKEQRKFLGRTMVVQILMIEGIILPLVPILYEVKPLDLYFTAILFLINLFHFYDAKHEILHLKGQNNKSCGNLLHGGSSKKQSKYITIMAGFGIFFVIPILAVQLTLFYWFNYMKCEQPVDPNPEKGCFKPNNIINMQVNDLNGTISNLQEDMYPISMPLSKLLNMLIFYKDSIQIISVYMILLLRLPKMYYIEYYYRKIIESTVYKNPLYIFKFAYFTFFYIHILTCIWFYVFYCYYKSYPDDKYNWLPPNLKMTGIGDKAIAQMYYNSSDLVEMYFQTFYNVLALMCGNDIQASNSFQVILSILIGNFGSINLGIVYGNLSYLIEKINFRSVNIITELTELREKLEDLDLDDNMQNKIIFYQRFCSENTKRIETSTRYSELSEPLEKEVQFEIFQKFKKVNLFKGLQPTEILSIVSRLKQKSYLPGDCIVEPGEDAQEMLFITKGQCTIIINVGLDDEKKSKLGAGDFFGDANLIKEDKTFSSLYADTFCVIHVLTKTDFEDLMNLNKQMKAKVSLNSRALDYNRKEDVIFKLKNCSQFENFKEYELKILCEYVEWHHVNPNEIVVKPQENVKNFMVIFSGEINFFNNDKKALKVLRKYNYIPEQDNHENLSNKKLKSKDKLKCLDKMIYKQLADSEDAADLTDSIFETIKMGDVVGSVSEPKYYNHFQISQNRVELLVLESYRIDVLKRQNYPVWKLLNEIYKKQELNFLGKLGAQKTSNKRVEKVPLGYSSILNKNQSQNLIKKTHKRTSSNLEQRKQNLSNVYEKYGCNYNTEVYNNRKKILLEKIDKLQKMSTEIHMAYEMGENEPRIFERQETLESSYGEYIDME